MRYFQQYTKLMQSHKCIYVMKRIFASFCTLYFLVIYTANAHNIKKINLTGLNLVQISQRLLLAAKTKEPTDSLVSVLEKISEIELEKQLITEDQRKAFWINIYNAYTQVILARDPDKYLKRGLFFGGKQIVIAGKALSLDDIEHGLLRHSKVKWSLGYFNKLFPSAFEKKNRVKKVDYRIHFSLNCGAKSCPPVAFYKPEQLDKQLEVATSVYLKGETEFMEKDQKVLLPAMMGWFRHDFGGKKKMKLLLKIIGIIPENSNPSIQFKKYDWNLFLENYKNE